MNVVEFAVQYVTENKLAKTPIYSANRFARMMGNLNIESIDEATLKHWQAKQEKDGLSVWSIKGGLKDLRTLIRAAGRDVKIAKIPDPEPNPQPVPLNDINAVWPYLAAWSRQWIVIAFWTALRFADTVRMQRVVEPDKLEWKASKTGRRHRWPVPEWLKAHLGKVPLPYTKSEDWSEVIVRAELERACKLAGVPRFLPNNVRDSSLREWVRADFNVGKVVHGCRLGVIGHYVDILDIIGPVAPRVRLPECFGVPTDKQPEAELVESFRMLDPQAKDLVLMTAQRMAPRRAVS